MATFVYMAPYGRPVSIPTLRKERMQKSHSEKSQNSAIFRPTAKVKAVLDSARREEQFEQLRISESHRGIWVRLWKLLWGPLVCSISMFSCWRLDKRLWRQSNQFLKALSVEGCYCAVPQNFSICVNRHWFLLLIQPWRSRQNLEIFTFCWKLHENEKGWRSVSWQHHKER